MRPLKVLLVFLHILLGLFLLVILGALWRPRSKAVKKAKVWWLGKVLDLIGIDVEIIGKPIESPANGKGILFVSNHVSWVDIPLIGSLNQINFLSKAEVLNWPLIGLLAKGVGTLFIQRGSGDSRKITQDIANNIKKGHSILFFPEGTTTDGGSVKTFHRRLFRTCELTDCMFQPVVIHYTIPNHTGNDVAFIGDDDFATHLWNLLKFKHIKATVEYLSPRSFDGLSLKADVLLLENEMRQCVELKQANAELRETNSTLNPAGI